MTMDLKRAVRGALTTESIVNHLVGWALLTGGGVAVSYLAGLELFAAVIVVVMAAILGAAYILQRRAGDATAVTKAAFVTQPLADHETWWMSRASCADGWTANMGIVNPVGSPRSLGLQLQTTGEEVAMREAYCVIQAREQEPSVAHPGPAHGDKRSNNFMAFFPEDFPGFERAWPPPPGDYLVTWMSASGGDVLASWEFRVTATGQLLPQQPIST